MPNDLHACRYQGLGRCHWETGGRSMWKSSTFDGSRNKDGGSVDITRHEAAKNVCFFISSKHLNAVLIGISRPAS